MCEINLVSTKYHYVTNIYRNAIFFLYSELNSDWVKIGSVLSPDRHSKRLAGGCPTLLFRKIKSVLNENNETYYTSFAD